ncbi:hypothetical protein BKA70DRAFT_1240166 [Coprinopsis sp. MPI-PUGE-AT-0042]|nr:hypothetical protein BKA70DRAFT_1240166 [Coprinopsis sp. MPI-PUGE-AT-0042]
MQQNMGSVALDVPLPPAGRPQEPAPAAVIGCLGFLAQLGPSAHNFCLAWKPSSLFHLVGRVIGEEIDTQLLLAHPQLELNLVGDDNDETTAVHHHPRFHLRLDARPADEEDRTPYDWQMHVPCDAPRPSRFALVLKAMDLASASTYGGRFNVNAVDSGWKMAAMWALEKGCDGGDGVGIEEGTIVATRASLQKAHRSSSTSEKHRSATLDKWSDTLPHSTVKMEQTFVPDGPLLSQYTPLVVLASRSHRTQIYNPHRSQNCKVEQTCNSQHQNHSKRCKRPAVHRDTF